jgi:8-oxo-dGTP diphosphatase
MRHSSRVLIQKDNKILFIHRHKKGVEFYVLPGGGIEGNETPEQGAIREAKEETGFDIEVGEILWKFGATSKKNDGDMYVFSVKKFSGELKLGGPEVKRNCEENKYEHEWIDIQNLQEIPIFPIEMKEKLIKKYNKK